jgi:hypothetical protein
MAIDASARFPLPPTPPSPDEPFWTSVRRQFLMPSDLIVMNAANLSPASIPVIDALNRSLMAIERDPSAFNRAKMGGRETCRELIAQFLNVRPGEIVIARNASDANNLVSNGIDLKPGDEVLVYSDNHSSNNAAWHDKARRFGFTVAVVDHVNPHPGAAHYIRAFVDRMTPRTRLLAITHVTGPTGDVLPVRELSRAARERGVLTLVDSRSHTPIDPERCVLISSRQRPQVGVGRRKWDYVGEDAQSRIWPTSSNPGRWNPTHARSTRLPERGDRRVRRGVDAADAHRAAEAIETIRAPAQWAADH